MPIATGFRVVSYLLAFAALVAVLEFGLLPALLSGLLVYNLVEFAAATLARFGASLPPSRILAVVALALLLVLAIAAGISSGISQFASGAEGIDTLLRKMAEIIDSTRLHAPDWAKTYLPADLEELEALAARMLREHAGQLQLVGGELGLLIIHIFVGMVVGGLVALSPVSHSPALRPLASELLDRTETFSRAFRNVVFSQIRISALNTALTAIYLVAILPLFGIHLPFVRTIIVVTFVVGLLPVVGNLISNTVIVVVSLSVSAVAALGSLAFLVAIHKLEYFVNARIIGGRINARAWEILLAMVVLEAWHGIPGLIAAPIYYAYLKDELATRGAI